MRHVVEKLEGNKYTTKGYEPIQHVLLWDDVSEHARAVLKYRSKRAIPDFTDSRAFRAGCSRREVIRWLGRTDLDSWQKVCDETEKPWKVGMDRVAKMQEQISRVQFATPKSIKRRGIWSSENDGDFDYDRYMSGVNAWRSVSKRDLTGQQFVTLVVNCASNCNVSANAMLWRGTAAIAATKILEEQGYSVEILSAYPVDSALQSNRAKHGSYSSQNVFQACWIKRADQPLDEAALVNAISPWYFRLLGFAAFYMIPGERCTHGLGHAVGIKNDCVDTITLGRSSESKLKGEHDAYIHVDGAYDRLSALRLANSIVQKFADHSEYELDEDGDPIIHEPDFNAGYTADELEKLPEDL